MEDAACVCVSVCEIILSFMCVFVSSENLFAPLSRVYCFVLIPPNGTDGTQRGPWAFLFRQFHFFLNFRKPLNLRNKISSFYPMWLLLIISRTIPTFGTTFGHLCFKAFTYNFGGMLGITVLLKDLVATKV